MLAIAVRTQGQKAEPSRRCQRRLHWSHLGVDRHRPPSPRWSNLTALECLCRIQSRGHHSAASRSPSNSVVYNRRRGTRLSSMSVRVAAVQMCSTADVASNLAKTRDLVGRAASDGAELVLLPENFAFLGPEPDKRKIAEDLDQADGPVVQTLRVTAQRHGVWLLGGGLPERSDDPDRPFNTCVLVGPDGRVSARYRKIHLFDVDLADGINYCESVATSAGDTPVLVEIAGLKVGLSICYDLRFPELYRRLTDLGAELLVVPAAFTLHTGKDHWRVLLRARAIEAQAFVLAAAQWGRHGRRESYGKSCIIDPWGEIMAQASEGEGTITCRLDRNFLELVRARVPSLRHRRL